MFQCGSAGPDRVFSPEMRAATGARRLHSTTLVAAADRQPTRCARVLTVGARGSVLAEMRRQHMATWGVVPAAGAGTRIQPLAFSKELLPLSVRQGEAEARPRAVGEFIVERFVAAGADRLCFVIAPGKSDIVQYFGGTVGGAPICYVLQDRPSGLCDAVFRAAMLQSNITRWVRQT